MFTSDNDCFGYRDGIGGRRTEATQLHRARTTQARQNAVGKAHTRTARRYAIVAAGCALFAIVYAQFSHGVHSPFMTFMFAIPFIGGVLPALLCRFAKAQPLPRVTRQAWALAIASLTVASCLKGVFDIAGTASSLLVVYVLATVAFLVVAAAGLLNLTGSASDGG